MIGDNYMALVEYVTCGDCECVSCIRSYICPKTACIEDPCIDCSGLPPYAPWNINEYNLCDYNCDEKKPSFHI